VIGVSCSLEGRKEKIVKRGREWVERSTSFVGAVVSSVAVCVVEE